MEISANSARAEDSGHKLYGFAPSARVQELQKRILNFMQEHIYPSEKELNVLAFSNDRWTIHPTEERLKKMAKSEGLWNLWIPVLALDLIHKRLSVKIVLHEGLFFRVPI